MTSGVALRAAAMLCEDDRHADREHGGASANDVNLTGNSPYTYSPKSSAIYDSRMNAIGTPAAMPEAVSQECAREPRLRPEERLLNRCITRLVRQETKDLNLYEDVDEQRWRAVIALAEWHRLLPLIHLQLRQDGWLGKVPRQVSDRLKQASLQAAMAHLSHVARLQEIASAFGDRGISYIVLKGVPLAESLYPEPALRSSADVDVMVEPSKVIQAGQALESLGYVHPWGQDVQAAFRRYHHHLAPYVHERDGVVVELHWDVLSPSSRAQLDVRDLWTRARTAVTGKVRCLVLCPEDQLLHLCLHFMNDRRARRHGGLLQVCDIALFLAKLGHQVNWDEFVDRAMLHSVGDEVFKTLHSTSTITGASLPDSATRRLRPDDFDEDRAWLFTCQRVIGRGRQVPGGVVEALAQQGTRRKLVGVAQALLPSVTWVPSASRNGSQKPFLPGVEWLLRPVRIIAGLAALILHPRELTYEVDVEKWLDEDRIIGLSQSKKIVSRA